MGTHVKEQTDGAGLDRTASKSLRKPAEFCGYLVQQVLKVFLRKCHPSHHTWDHTTHRLQWAALPTAELPKSAKSPHDPSALT